MTDEKAMADPKLSVEDELQVALEARLIESTRSMNLTDHLARSRATYRKVASALLKVEDELKEREHQREIANEALGVALRIITGTHHKTAASHKKGDGHAKCGSCIMIRTLGRQLVRSSRATSRMGLAS